MSSKPKRTALSIYDIRYRSSSMRPGGYSMRCWVGGVPGHWNPSYQRHILVQLIPWEYDPPGFELFCIHESRLTGTILFNITSNALFCVLQVWQDFICFVVQRLLSRGANFHSSKHIRNYTQDGFVNLRFKSERRSHKELCFAAKQKQFVNDLLCEVTKEKSGVP